MNDFSIITLCLFVTCVEVSLWESKQINLPTRVEIMRSTLRFIDKDEGLLITLKRE